MRVKASLPDKAFKVVVALSKALNSSSKRGTIVASVAVPLEVRAAVQA